MLNLHKYQNVICGRQINIKVGTFTKSSTTLERKATCQALQDIHLQQNTASTDNRLFKV